MAEDNTLVINARVEYAQAVAGLKTVQNSISKLGSKVGVDNLKQLARAQQSVYMAQQNLNTALGKFQFQGWALSVMFFGMALQRTFDGIEKSATKAYDEAAHSVWGTVTANDKLQGSMQYLGIVIGEALQPFLEMLLPVVDFITSWVEENQGLTATVIALGVALGALFTLVGGGVLAFYGLRQAIMLIFGTDILAGLTRVGGLFGVIKTAVLELITTLGTLSVAELAAFAGVTAGIGLAIYWIYQLQAAMGGWGEFGKSVIRGILRALVMLGQGIVDLVLSPINLVINALNSVIYLYNRLVSSDIGKNLGMKAMSMINTVQSPDLMGAYFEWEQSSWLAPSQGYATGGGLTPSYNQPQSVVNIGTVNVQSNSVEDMLNQLKQYNVPTSYGIGV